MGYKGVFIAWTCFLDVFIAEYKIETGYEMLCHSYRLGVKLWFSKLHVYFFIVSVFIKREHSRAFHYEDVHVTPGVCGEKQMIDTLLIYRG